MAKESNLSDSILDRLMLNKSRIKSMSEGLIEISKLYNPIGEIIENHKRPNGLRISKIRVPLGVIGIIYESRPNVTADAAGLCIKSGNCGILRGGSESFFSSQSIMHCIHAGLNDAKLPKSIIQSIPTKDRMAVGEFLKMNKYIDILIPRGGKNLIERVQNESKIPVMSHLDGICHTYIDSSANKNMALNVIINAKMRRTGICGATETLLCHKKVKDTILPILIKNLINLGCEIRGDKHTQKLNKNVIPAKLQDWHTEYLDSIVSIKIVNDSTDAIDHINSLGSNHTDAIITEDKLTAKQFLSEVDSAIVMHNTSTQFADGGEFGMGAEIGISTGKLHARGPVGIKELTTYKYVVEGTGQIRN